MPYILYSPVFLMVSGNWFLYPLQDGSKSSKLNQTWDKQFCQVYFIDDMFLY